MAVSGAVPFAVACGEKKPVIVDAGIVATATPAVDATVILDQVDAAVVADAADAAPSRKPGVAVNPNVARLKQCCGQLRTQAKVLGGSPEAGIFLAAAAQCDTLVSQAGGSGTAPELAILKGTLAGRSNVPPVCAGF